ncbi:hypothetical protein A7D17_15500 [Xanthomonas floridensis]|uniref:Uncharacterized protein n=1 Tax=Xanthomonas floridensis TaxID=1843580 RepID=A0A1A9MC87_9XANT|nr:hypothetical protein A7D17_15500 [Xanthomonas floridensis]
MLVSKAMGGKGGRIGASRSPYVERAVQAGIRPIHRVHRPWVVRGVIAGQVCMLEVGNGVAVDH